MRQIVRCEQDRQSVHTLQGETGHPIHVADLEEADS